MARMLAQTEERRLFTVDDLDRMVEAGIIDEDEHVELLDGEILIVGKQGPTHSTLAVIVRDLLRQVYGRAGHLRDHSNLRLDDFNLPEPDVAVVRGEPRAYLQRLPTGADVVLVVEVTVTSHARDRRKARNYARARIGEYWLLDVPARQLVVHRDPGDEGYATITVLDDAALVALPEATASIAVRELLP